MNPFERMKRAAKVQALLGALDASGLQASASTVRAFSDDQWALLTEIARRLSRDEEGHEVNYSDPGPETIDAVVRLLEKREALLKPIRVIGARSKSSQVVELRAVSLVRPRAPDPFAPAARSRARRELCKPGAVRWGAP